MSTHSSHSKFVLVISDSLFPCNILFQNKLALFIITASLSLLIILFVILLIIIIIFAIMINLSHIHGKPKFYS